MGFELSGIAINKNYQNNFEELQNELGWRLKKDSIIDFETASADVDLGEFCDVYFSEKGTLMFLTTEKCCEYHKVKNATTLTFGISEAAKAFNLFYTENGIEKRSFIEFNHERPHDEGAKLPMESEHQDTVELFRDLIESILGKSYSTIKPNEQVTRYVFIDQNTEGTVANADIQSKMNSKKWWEFWK